MSVTVVTKDTFDTTVAADKLVLVDFFATWCGPCKMLGPVLEELSEELPEDRMIVKLDIDQNVDIARKFGVMSVPTMIVFKKGKALAKMIGLHPKEDVIELFEAAAKL